MVLTATYLQEVAELRQLLGGSVFREAVQLFAAPAEYFLHAVTESGSPSSPNRRVAVRKAVKKASAEVDVFKFHDSSVAFQNALERLPIVPDDISDCLLKGIADVKDLYKKFLDAQDDASAISLSWASFKLHERLKAVEGVWDHLLVSLTPSDDKVPAEYEVTEIRGSGDLTLAEFGRALSLIAEVYALACDLVGVNVREHPLLIVKVESGSLWARLAGDLKAVGATKIALLIAALERGRQHLTASGRLEDDTRQAMRVMELREALKSAGLSTRAMDAEMEQTGAAIARKSRKLVEAFDAVSIDEKNAPGVSVRMVETPHKPPSQIGYEKGEAQHTDE